MIINNYWGKWEWVPTLPSRINRVIETKNGTEWVIWERDSEAPDSGRLESTCTIKELFEKDGREGCAEY